VQRVLGHLDNAERDARDSLSLADAMGDGYNAAVARMYLADALMARFAEKEEVIPL
jgi:hypothetical protein